MFAAVAWFSGGGIGGKGFDQARQSGVTPAHGTLFVFPCGIRHGKNLLNPDALTGKFTDWSIGLRLEPKVGVHNVHWSSKQQGEPH